MDFDPSLKKKKKKKVTLADDADGGVAEATEEMDDLAVDDFGEKKKTT